MVTRGHASGVIMASGLVIIFGDVISAGHAGGVGTAGQGGGPAGHTGLTVMTSGVADQGGDGVVMAVQTGSGRGCSGGTL